MGNMRQLKDDERALLTKLILSKPDSVYLLALLNNAIVEEMNDGGMGSLRFSIPGKKSRRFSKQLLEKEFVDTDGVPIMVAINLDEQGLLYELDIWKVDFSSLKRFPVYENGEIKR